MQAPRLANLFCRNGFVASNATALNSACAALSAAFRFVCFSFMVVLLCLTDIMFDRLQS